MGNDHIFSDTGRITVMKIALAQINPTVGDLPSNFRKIIDFIAKAKEAKADLVIFPELATTGYPPEDLLLKPQFVADNLAFLKKISSQTKDIAVFVGFVDSEKDGLYNAGAFIENKKITYIYRKMNLPNYSVFDEKRYFLEGKKPLVVEYCGHKIGFCICEDIWAKDGPYALEKKSGADVIININASPYNLGKVKAREEMLKERAKKLKAHIIYLNMAGGQDELVFDGGSMVFDPSGKLIASCRQFSEELKIVDLRAKPKIEVTWLPETEEIYEALVLCVSDYIKKNKFTDVIIGVSGGIDSALTLAIACDAISPQNVHAVFMPSKYTSDQSYTDAKELAKNHGVEMKVVPIDGIFNAYLSEVTPYFKGKAPNIAEENLQARIRGNILMAFSNKFGWLVLTTGNKSETSTGYCTLYGDMAGGFDVLKDVTKTRVYKICKWLNKKGEMIPEAIIKRAPTAELRPNQKDQDTLPPYDILDEVIELYVEKNLSLAQIVERGIDPQVAKKAVSLVDASEYKRRQAPPGPRVTARAFGKDWRLPITNRYQHP